MTFVLAMLIAKAAEDHQYIQSVFVIGRQNCRKYTVFNILLAFDRLLWSIGRPLSSPSQDLQYLGMHLTARNGMQKGAGMLLFDRRNAVGGKCLHGRLPTHLQADGAADAGDDS